MRPSPLLLMLALVTPATAASSASAEGPICAKREQYVEFLKRDRNETQERVEVVSEKTVIEFFVSPAGTWTVLTTTATGLSCLARTGDEHVGRNLAGIEVSVRVDHTASIGSSTRGKSGAAGPTSPTGSVSP